MLRILKCNGYISTLEDIINDNWQDMKSKLRATWSKLTLDEIAQVQGEAEALAGLLQKKYGYSKERAKLEIEEFTKKQGWD